MRWVTEKFKITVKLNLNKQQHIFLLKGSISIFNNTTRSVPNKCHCVKKPYWLFRAMVIFKEKYICFVSLLNKRYKKAFPECEVSLRNGMNFCEPNWIILISLNINPTKWSNKNNSSVSPWVFECVWPFCGVWKVNAY